MNNNPKLTAAFELFNAKKMDEAIRAYDELLADAELPIWIKVRLKQYKAIAERMLSSVPELEPGLKTYAYFVNLGNLEKAEEMLERMDASESDRLFMTAELAILRGEVDKAFEILKSSLQHDEHNLGYALHSPAFQPILPKRSLSTCAKRTKTPPNAGGKLEADVLEWARPPSLEVDHPQGGQMRVILKADSVFKDAGLAG